MTGSIARRVAVAAAVTVFGVLSVAAVGVAQATDGRFTLHTEHNNYPPKCKLTLVADRATVPVGQKVTLTANYVGSGCSVKFAFGKQTKTVGSQNGFAQVTFVSTATHGTVQASATTVGCKFHETAYTSVKASSPSISLPGYIKKSQGFHVSIYQFPALTNINVRVYNAHFSKTVVVKTGSGGSASPWFTVPTSGSYVVVASGAGAYASATFFAH